MNTHFKSYAHQELSIREIKGYAKQYEEVNIWELVGLNEDEFPFLIWSSESDFTVMYWTKHSGLMAYLDEDPVRNYAFAIWLKDNAHPVFQSIKHAEEYAASHNWTRE